VKITFSIKIIRCFNLSCELE